MLLFAALAVLPQRDDASLSSSALSLKTGQGRSGVSSNREPPPSEIGEKSLVSRSMHRPLASSKRITCATGGLPLRWHELRSRSARAQTLSRPQLSQRSTRARSSILSLSRLSLFDRTRPSESLPAFLATVGRHTRGKNWGRGGYQGSTQGRKTGFLHEGSTREPEKICF